MTNHNPTADYSVSMVAEGAGLRSVTTGPVLVARGEHNTTKAEKSQ